MRRLRWIGTVTALGLAATTPAVRAAPAPVVRVSVSSTGEQANAPSRAVAISAGGRFVLFDPRASNLVPGDPNGHRDVFLHDVESGTTDLTGMPGRNRSVDLYLRGRARSATDRVSVSLTSRDRGFVPADTNRFADVFVAGPLP